MQKTKVGIATAVRIIELKGRQGTYPFEAVKKDAKSAITLFCEKIQKKYQYVIQTLFVGYRKIQAGGHLFYSNSLVENLELKGNLD